MQYAEFVKARLEARDPLGDLEEPERRCVPFAFVGRRTTAVREAGGERVGVEERVGDAVGGGRVLEEGGVPNQTAATKRPAPSNTTMGWKPYSS